MEIRTLHAREGDALLDLLDGWSPGDGWSGRGFFRRYLEQDPTFEPRNVWVALESGALVSCVQIFPRLVTIGECSVPLGGIGSVFTREDQRGRGTASVLLGHAIEAMRRRGFELSLLFATRIPFYTRLGWRSWKVRRGLLRRKGPEQPGAPGIRLDRLDPERDLDAVRAVHAEYSGARGGAALRELRRDWEASLRLAGNPAEDFYLARRADEVVAYARATALSGILAITEFGRREGEAPVLAALLGRILEPREDEPFRTAGKSSAELRAVASLPRTGDPELEALLEQPPFELQWVDDPTGMLRVLAPEALARRLGLPPGSDPWALLERALPAERFLYWPADRF